jgi:hypothetical protein
MGIRVYSLSQRRALAAGVQGVENIAQDLIRTFTTKNEQFSAFAETVGSLLCCQKSANSC